MGYMKFCFIEWYFETSDFFLTKHDMRYFGYEEQTKKTIKKGC